VKQITTGITLFLFLASSALGSLEQFPASFGAHSEALLLTLEEDISSDNARGRRALKRSQRGKFSLKNLPLQDKPARVISSRVRTRATSFILYFSKSSISRQLSLTRYSGTFTFIPNGSKSSVYQQTNVYRI
jgi:hypothetical protein